MAVVNFEVTLREPFAGGQRFGDVGAYERIDGVLTFAVDPAHEANSRIVDLGLATRDAEGRVRFESDVVLVAPVDLARGNGALILDVPNRGRTIASYLNGATDRGSAGAGVAIAFAPFGGHTYRRGFSILTVGWQTDMVPMEHSLEIRPPIAGTREAPVTGQVWAELRPMRNAACVEVVQLRNRPYPPLDRDQPAARLYEYRHETAAPRLIPRARWRFAQLTDAGERPSDAHITLEGGFGAGHIYCLAYTAAQPPVVGSGLLALRDATSFVKSGAGGALGGGFRRALGFGVSQTAVVLRYFLNLGLNRDENEGQVLDGVLTVIGGSRGRSETNHRFALPSTATFRSFSGRFPFADATLTDPHTGETDGVLARLDGLGASPKVLHLNTAHEYWHGASLLHTDPGTGEDAALHPGTRAYMIPGAHHSSGALPQGVQMSTWAAPARYGTDVISYAPLMRAALVNLDAWVAEDIAPPDSRVPRLSDGSGVRREAALGAYAALPGIEPLPVERLRVPRMVDLGPEAADGIGTYPPLEGAEYACVVSATDADLNDVAGIRWPDVAVPVGTHVGWNVLDTGTGRSEYPGFLWGMTRFFSRTEAERAATGDPRPSLEARYTSREDYIEQVRAAAEQLVAERFLLAEDVDLVVDNCALRYDEALRVGPFNPAE